MKKLAFAALFVAFSHNASALEAIDGNVTLVEASYLPSTVVFTMGNGNATCPAGSWFKWQKSQESNTMVYSGLLTALTQGLKVRLYINNGDTNCVGTNLHFLK